MSIAQDDLLKEDAVATKACDEVLSFLSAFIDKDEAAVADSEAQKNEKQ